MWGHERRKTNGTLWTAVPQAQLLRRDNENARKRGKRKRKHARNYHDDTMMIIRSCHPRTRRQPKYIQSPYWGIKSGVTKRAESGASEYTSCHSATRTENC